MKVEKKEVLKDRVNCNFCKQGELSKDGSGLIYPYNTVYEFGHHSGGLMATICEGCLNELFEKTKP